MITFLKNYKNYLSTVFFIIFLLVGISIFNDYGISIDEDNTRINGLVGLKYILSFFSLHTGDFFLNIPDIKDYNEKGIGYIFDLPAALIEYFFNLEDSRNYYLARHFLNFLFFYLGVFYFFLILKNRFKSEFLPILGCLFLVLSPRIFAESFYNNKDIIFLSLFIIATYYSLLFLDKPSHKNSLLLAFTISLAVGVRVAGIMLPLIFIFIYFIKVLRYENNKINLLKPLYSFLIFLPILMIIFYPFLWESPIENLFFIIKSLSNFKVYDHYNFYLGEFIKANYIPWNYTLVWIISSTPIFYTFLFFLGFILMLHRLILRLLNIDNKKINNDLWRGNNEMKDLLFFLLFFLPIFATIILNSTLYNGWRHMYFIYPYFLIIAIYGLNRIQIRFFKRKKNLSIIFSIIFILPTVTWMIKNHPHQYSYFNFFLKNDFDKKFELDYWGLSNYQALLYLSQKAENKIKVSRVSDTDLQLSKQFLPKKLREKILIVGDVNDSDFIIDNKIHWNGVLYKKERILKKNFIKFYEVKVDNISINTIYKNLNDK